MIVTIKRVEDAAKDDHSWKYIIYDKDGSEKKKAVFDTKFYPLLVEGATIDIELKKNDKYWDIVNIKPSTAQAAVNNDKSGTFAESALRQRSIEKQNALTNAVSLWAAIISKSDLPDKIEDMVLATADRFYKHTSAKGQSADKPEDEPLFEERYSIRTQPEYEESVRKLAHKLGYTTVKQLSEFITRNSPMLPDTAWKAYGDGLKGVFIALLQKEAENV